MESRYNRFTNIYKVEFSKQELEKINELKCNYENLLFEQFSYSFEIFDLETSTHIIPSAKINALEKIKLAIEDGPIFDKSYFDVLRLKGATIQFNDEKFIEFAVGYSILDHDAEQSAFIVLKEIWQVHLLNLMILDCHEKNTSLSSNYLEINLKYDDTIFPNTISHEFFLQTINRSQFKVNRKWVSQLFRFLRSKNDGKNECYVVANEFQFADYWKKNIETFEIKKYDKKTSMAPIDQSSDELLSIKAWYKEFSKI